MSSGVAEVNPQYLAEAASNADLIGYKQTEAGDIPLDWECHNFGDLVDYKKGYAFKSEQYGETGTRIIRVSDTSYADIKDESPIFISDKLAKLYQAWSLRESDLIFSTVGSKPPMYDSLVGKAIYVTKKHEGSLLNQNAVRIRAKSKTEGIQALLLNHFRTERYIDFIEVIYRGNANQASITLENLFEFKIPLPSLEKEQTAIANALSDVDALISELEKLIAKKQAIKTATMQQLLTGRTRLPQFALREDGTLKGTKPSELGEIPEDWEVKTYGEVFTFLSTSTNSRADLSEDGDLGYVHYGDIHTEWNNKLDLNKERLPRISKNIVCSAFVMDGDLIMADASEDYEGIGKTVEVFNVGEKQIVAGLHTFLLRDKEKVLADGFRGYLHGIPAVKSSFDRLATGMKVYGISKNNLSSVCIPVPSLEEQTAIATILSDMDAEIQALEQRLGKTRQIKQGMMQELLTGKTRLIKPSKEVIHE
ncbi:restriction endonuclease subunit S [Vibrio cholerae]